MKEEASADTQRMTIIDNAMRESSGKFLIIVATPSPIQSISPSSAKAYERSISIEFGGTSASLQQAC